MLTSDEQRRARELGWELRDVYDLRTRRFYMVPMDVEFPAQPVVATQRLLYDQAKNREPVALRALALVAQSNIYRRST